MVSRHCCQLLQLLVLLGLTTAVMAFAPQPMSSTLARRNSLTRFGAASFDDEEDEASEEASDETPRNPDRPELPELKGDFDWDAKFASDEDWIVDSVPGKIVLNELELAEQVTALTKLEETWRKQTLVEEYEASQQVGFVEGAELANGRFAMFFIVTGLLTEYWTGYSLPQQVEEMLRVLGFIGFET